MTAFNEKGETMKLQTPIVSTDWLDEHLGEPDLRIYDVTLYVEYKGDAGDSFGGYNLDSETPRKEWEQAHIPGSDFIDINGEPKQEYCTSTSEHYELYHEIEYKPNRLVIYPDHLLYSTIVCPDTDINSDPQTGRLTANIFIEFK